MLDPALNEYVATEEGLEKDLASILPLAGRLIEREERTNPLRREYASYFILVLVPSVKCIPERVILHVEPRFHLTDSSRFSIQTAANIWDIGRWSCSVESYFDFLDEG